MACSSDLGSSTATCPFPPVALHRLDTTGSAIIGTIHGQVLALNCFGQPTRLSLAHRLRQSGRGPLLADFVLLEEKIALDLIEGISWGQVVRRNDRTPI